MLRHGYGTSYNKVIIRMGRTDLRYGIDKLAALLELEYGLDPAESGTLYLFCGSRLDRIKGLLYEGDGYTLLTKRLTNGAFQWPRTSDEAREMSEEDFGRLMDGFTVESSIKTFPKVDSGVDGEGEFSHEASDFISHFIHSLGEPSGEENGEYAVGNSEKVVGMYQNAIKI